MRLGPEYTPPPRNFNEHYDLRKLRRGTAVKLRIALVTAREALRARPRHAAARGGPARGGRRRRDAVLGRPGRGLGPLRCSACCARPGTTSSASTSSSPGASGAPAHTRLLNPPAVVRWNTDKHYLAHLHGPACPWCRRASSSLAVGAARARRVPRRRQRGVHASARRATFSEFVVKPAIGAGSRDAARYGRDDAGRALEHLRATARRGSQRAAAAVPRARGRARRDGGAVPRRRIQPRGPQGTAAACRRWPGRGPVRARGHPPARGRSCGTRHRRGGLRGDPVRSARSMRAST